MYWDADNVEYRNVSMDCAYSGSTLIWSKKKAELVTETTQITSAGTYVLAYPADSTIAAVGLSTDLKTVSGNTSHMYVTWAPFDDNSLLFIPGGSLIFKIYNRFSYSDGWYHLQDVATNNYLAYYDGQNVVGITYPYLSSGSTGMDFQITKSVDHHSSGHIKDLPGYTIRFTNGNDIWKYPAGASSPDEFTYRVATTAGQTIAMLYRIK